MEYTGSPVYKFRRESFISGRDLAVNMPIYINGTESGVLRITKDGLYTVLEAELPGDAERLVRLWAHGDGKSAYLGVMQPWSGGLWLRRKLSRRELAAFPDPIELASDREREENGTTEEEKQGAVESSKGETAEGEEEDVHPAVNAEKSGADEDAKNRLSAETDLRACPWPAEPPEDGLLWYSRPDGSLVSFDGISSLVAFPAELRARRGGAAERVIEGKKYLVFRY